ncbi:molybdopterin-guanine dinucleotide biosynthesis protein [Raineyella fluvialis]|uniref:Molybdopterin-guanine dinucleotide biosynthesis protein n=2 Tax=Raineyella fluvialis TaxID=2662261 RepID=A0A5Q2FEK8_9ACTN|nr:molybdopterin-guanine dinucleotide biosynthesis protein [Raineyella fluvialis]
MRVMGEWLDAVSAELGLDPALLEQVRTPMLDMIAEVAHGPSRPGAPMTAMLVGLASDPQDPAAMLDRVARIRELAAGWVVEEAQPAQD